MCNIYTCTIYKCAIDHIVHFSADAETVVVNAHLNAFDVGSASAAATSYITQNCRKGQTKEDDDNNAETSEARV